MFQQTTLNVSVPVVTHYSSFTKYNCCLPATKTLWPSGLRRCVNPFQPPAPKKNRQFYKKMALARLPLLSFDIETAGEIAGIVQISAEIVCFKINSAKKKVGSDMPATYYERKTPSTDTLTRRFVQNTGISTLYLCMASSQTTRGLSMLAT